VRRIIPRSPQATRRASLRLSLGSVACIIATGCGCDLAVFARYSPQAQSLTIGQQFTPQLQFVSCGGDKVERDVVRWMSSDTTVAITDSLTGTTRARAQGQATLTGTGRTNGIGATISIMVTP
jgi:Bacterial Ig-like domain (group 2)